MTDSIYPSVEVLLEHATWMRELARRLVRDPGGADDVAQAALVAASMSAPRERSSLRAWLATVVRNAARERQRGERRRALREMGAAREEALPSTEEVVERAEAQRELVEAVLALEEPYRTTILLRFFEERNAHEVAVALGVPDATVRTHVARGLARLRTRLDRKHGGDRAAWTAILLPIAARGDGVSPSLLGALFVNTPVKIGIVVAGLVVAALLVVRTVGREESRGAPESVVERTVPARSDEGRGLVGSDPGSVTRSEVERSRVQPRDGVAQDAIVSQTLRGRVMDEHGIALSGVPVALVLSGNKDVVARAVSSDSGEFEIERPTGSGQIADDDPAYVTVFAGVVGRLSSAGPAVVVAPATMLRGFVVDVQGVPVAGAKVHVQCPEEMRTRIPENLDASEALSWSAQSDVQGSYAFTELPRLLDARLECTHEGFVPFAMALGDALGGPFVITLARPGAQEAAVRGRVVDTNGAPVEGAWVALGVETTKSDEHGLFALKLDDPQGRNAQFNVAAVRLVATCKGYLPGELAAPIVDGHPVWPQHVTLKMGTQALSIAGTVQDHLGRLRAGVKVFVADPAFFGEVDGGPAQLENVIGGHPSRSWSFVETDADGRFTIEGLCAHAYIVRALEPETLLRTDVPDVQAGTSGLVISMPRDALYPRVAGVVRTHDGTPVADAHVFPMCDAFQARMNGRIVSTSHDGLDGVATDAEGRFTMTDVPKSLVYLRVEREDVLPLEYGRYVEGDARFVDSIRELPKDRIESLDIRVDRRAHVQVELSDPALADEFALLDENGKALEVSVFIGQGRREGRRSPIVEGKSYVTAGTDRAKTLVLYKGGAEVGRKGVKLVPAETTTVRW